ncbi:MAG: hypothetical protein F6K32_00750 [Desertifilum sp. SIO1I2]|nr:hypothetical protein [Desertifilum sp. SIO1I2]
MRRKVTEALKAIGVLDPELIRLRKNELLILLRQAQEKLPPPDRRKDLKETTSKQLEIDTHPQVDWGEAVDVSVFYGRTEELATLEQWIVQDGCRLVVLLGMGGIGKTYLSIKLTEQIQDRFDYVIWRSLRNAPLVQDMLTNLLQLLCNNQEIDFPDDISGKVSLLINYLRSSRCLLVLDNVESILRCGECAGQYREGYEGYGQFVKRVGEAIHQSCLILTSREEPEEISSLQGETRPIRSFRLSGLGEEAKEIFRGCFKSRNPSKIMPVV